VANLVLNLAVTMTGALSQPDLAPDYSQRIANTPQRSDISVDEVKV